MNEPSEEQREYELTPLDPVTDGVRLDSAPGGGFAIPADPVHLCPNCGYNLAGLKHRRCPECGNVFNLRAARMAAEGGAWPFDRHDLRVLRNAKRRRAIGLYLTAAGLGVPTWLAPAPRDMIVLLLLLFAPMAFLSWIVAYTVDLDWCSTILVWGVLAALLGVLATMAVLL
ncbi:MAG: hypothetical protein HUU22_05710 [Phycisphaerae bacterium]|nr:hypothetical protein [Phycisphaerae bacterium]NUQ45509.1 hypothetical protein [Phycisphaerae bacterium]